MSEDFYDEDEDMDHEETYEYEEELDADVEEISSDDVDTVVASLNTVNETVSSENIRLVIENAIDEILHLVYTDDELLGADEDEDDDMLSEAA